MVRAGVVRGSRVYMCVYVLYGQLRLLITQRSVFCARAIIYTISYVPQIMNGTLEHHHQSVMELGHLLTRSGLSLEHNRYKY